MSRIALTSADMRMKALRRQYVPILSVIAAASLEILPIVVSTPIVPDLAFLVLIAWRLLRPELWQATVALPLGFYNDLLAGHPLGQSMALWTIAFLAFDLVDSRVLFRDYWMDWFIASLAIVGYVSSSWFISRLLGSQTELVVSMPQLVASILTYPVVARFVLALDRWRLAR